MITRNLSRNWGAALWLGGILLVALLAPLQAETKDLPNFHTVGTGIYRGGVPTVAGMKKLKEMGIHTIIDLRISPHQVQAEKKEAERLGFTWINLPMGSDPPTTKQVATLLATLKRAPQESVFVHCQHGADRTGCMIGIWRVTQQGWAFSKAWTEMRQYGFDPRWSKLTEAVRKRAPAETTARKK